MKAHPVYSFRTLTDGANRQTVSGYIHNDAMLTVSGMELGDDPALQHHQALMDDDRYVLLNGKDISLSQNS
jgi:hypothetical protein